MLKTWVLVLGLLCSIVLGVVSMVQTPWLSTMLLRQALTARPGVIVKDVVVAGQQFSWPDHFYFHDVRIVVELQGKELELEAPGIHVRDGRQWLTSRRSLKVDASHLRLRYDALDVMDINGQFTVVPGGVKGPVSARVLRWGKWQATNASAFMVVDASGVQAMDLRCRAYGGGMNGRITVRRNATAFIYAGEIFTQGLDLAKLQDADPSIPTQLDGIVSGGVGFEGDASSLRMLDITLNMPAGGTINAALLGALAQYLPASREKKRLDALISIGGKLGMERFALTLKGGQEGSFAGEIHLKSRAVNLELNLTHEINTDGTLASLLAYVRQFVQ